MTKDSRMMRLGAFVHETGQHVAAWRHPDAYAESGTVFAQAMDVAKTAERPGRVDNVQAAFLDRSGKERF